VLAVAIGAIPVAAAKRAPKIPLIGANYAHYAIGPKCDLTGRGIVYAYSQPGVAATVDRQLRAMRASGITSIRLILWHMTSIGSSAAPRQQWGVVPSAGGRLSQPFRTNLARYAAAVRRRGFQRLTVAFGPQWSNRPFESNFDPAKIDENWAFIKDARSIIKASGPRDVHFDLLNEGGPSAYAPASRAANVRAYLSELYRRYVRAFGAADVTVSVIEKDFPGDQQRLQNLIDILRASGARLPPWFEVHVGDSEASVLRGLENADATLSRNGLKQPLVIGEVAYNNASAARGIVRFRAESRRRVQEVIEWPQASRAQCAFSVAPPYRADAYLSALR
jgi:hypothetical protein